MINNSQEGIPCLLGFVFNCWLLFLSKALLPQSTRPAARYNWGCWVVGSAWNDMINGWTNFGKHIGFISINVRCSQSFGHNLTFCLSGMIDIKSIARDNDAHLWPDEHAIDGDRSEMHRNTQKRMNKYLIKSYWRPQRCTHSLTLTLTITKRRIYDSRHGTKERVKQDIRAGNDAAEYKVVNY